MSGHVCLGLDALGVFDAVRNLKLLGCRDDSIHKRSLFGLGDFFHVDLYQDRTAEVLACLRRQAFDVILLNLSLPDSPILLDSFLETNAASKGAPIVVLADEEDENLAGEPADNLIFDKTSPLKTGTAPKGFDQTSLMLMGCVARSLQISGALQYMLTRSVNYSQERVAFEKKISKFQAVQHNLARLAGESAAALAAATSAADAIANATAFNDEVFLEAVAAKIRCAEAAEKGGAIAHQVHGAIGFTIEHILHRYSLRALAWRDDFGSESYWAVELGKLVAKRGADELWPLVASR